MHTSEQSNIVFHLATCENTMPSVLICQLLIWYTCLVNVKLYFKCSKKFKWVGGKWSTKTSSNNMNLLLEWIHILWNKINQPTLRHDYFILMSKPNHLSLFLTAAPPTKTHARTHTHTHTINSTVTEYAT